MLALVAALAILLLLGGALPAAAAEPPASPPASSEQTELPATVVEAGTPDAGPSVAEDDGDGTAGAIVRLVVGLAVVLVVIACVSWLVRLWTRSRGVKTDTRLTVVATTVLAQNRALHLVRVGDELVLVGSAEHGVTPIRIYDADEARHLDGLLGTGETPGGLVRPFGSRGGGLDGLRRLTTR